MDFLLCGKGISDITLILYGYMQIPYLDTIKPRSFPSLRETNDFLGFKEIPNFLHF